jgi:opacity protein-like surface antigen
MGSAGGDNPSPGYGDSEDYQLGGNVVSAFVGIDRNFQDNMFAGVELAWTGPTEGDVEENSSYEYAYDVSYNIDAKLRVGTMLGQAKVYGFAGVSTGSVSSVYYGSDYTYFGTNIGAGASFEVMDGVSVGAEHIVRFTDGKADGADPFSGRSDATTLRVSFEF